MILLGDETSRNQSGAKCWLVHVTEIWFILQIFKHGGKIPHFPTQTSISRESPATLDDRVALAGSFQFVNGLVHTPALPEKGHPS